MSSYYAVYDLQRHEFRDDFYGENKEEIQKEFRAYWGEIRYWEDEKDRLEIGLSEEEYYAIENAMTDEEYLNLYDFVVKEIELEELKKLKGE